jgi:carbon monoxide dehydrogenase subunit G
VQLEHRFTVPASPETVWAALIDPERVAPCMPGATLSSVEGNSFAGSVKVKLGPISLLYKGSGEFIETDEAARQVVIKASGKDSRGNGTAAATVTVKLTGEGASTSATVSTDLAITGKPAQFGRGMIIEVGGKILDTFANCLSGKLAPAQDSAAGKSGDAKLTSVTGKSVSVAPARRATPARDAESNGSGSAGSGSDDAEEPAPRPAARRRATRPAAKPKTETTASAGDATEKAAEKLTAAPSPQAAAADAPTVATPAGPPPLTVVDSGRHAAAEPETEAIDLLGYAGPSLAKRVIPAVVVLIVLFIVVRRLRR